jgi:hypothetical protein
MSVRPKNNQFAGMKANRINLDGASHYPKVWHLPHWKKGDDTTRMAVLREIAESAGHDPRMATLAINILKANKVEPRDYTGQARALLKWVQNNVYYINEPAERLQDPLYTLKVLYGDCDDMALLLGALYESIKLEWRFVLSGKVNGKPARWIEGTPLPKNGLWSHIYLLVGYPPFQPKKWQFAEPTLRGVDLGWDIIQSMKKGERLLPEMGSTERGILTIDSEKVKARKEKRQKIITRWKEKLDPEILVSDIMIVAITTVLTRFAIEKLKTLFTDKKK